MLHTLLPHSAGLQIRQTALPHSARALLIRHILNILKANGGHEIVRLPGLGDLGVKFVDLLERQTLGLVDHKVDEGDADEAEAAPDEEDLGLQIRVAWAGVDHVGRGVGDGPVQEPVGGGRHGEGFGADFEREDLARHDPGDGAPGAGDWNLVLVDMLG